MASRSLVALDVAWPRRAVYNAVGHPEVIAEHRVIVDLPEPVLGEVAP